MWTLERKYDNWKAIPVMSTVSPYGTLIAFTSADTTARVWEVSTGREIHKLQHATLTCRGVFSPDGRRLYTVDGRHGRITVVDTVRGIVADTITADGAIAVVLSPDGKTLYVVNGENSSLDILDLETKKRGKQIPLGNGTIDADISPDGSLLFISNQHSYSVTVVDSKHQELAANIQVGTFPMGIKVSPDGKRAYVCNWIDGDVSIIDTAAKREISRVLVKSTPLAIAVYHSP